VFEFSVPTAMICGVCRVDQSCYRCPACGARTCSLQCTRQHKADTGCPGTRPKTQFVPLAEMNAHTLACDCALLDSISAKQQLAQLPRHSRDRKYGKDVIKFCNDQGITLRRLPRESSRSKENKTRLAPDKTHVLWTVRWRFHRPDKSTAFETVVSGIHESSRLADTFNAIVETTPNDEVAAFSLDIARMLMVAEGAEGGGFYECEPFLGLKDNLFAKTVIEYPIIDVVSLDSLFEWKIVTILEVKKVEKPKSDMPDEKPPPDLPTYQEIKQALKLDIIKGVLDRAAEEAIPLPVRPS
jgi:hypothetical protein